MKKAFACVLLFYLCSAICLLSHAAGEHADKKVKYVALENGVAPNGQLSLDYRDVGNEPSGSEHLYLLREPDHTLLQTVGDIESFGPVYEVYWAPNSSAVIILYRTDLNYWERNLYRVKGRRLVRVLGLDVLDAVAKKAGMTAHAIRKNEHACHFKIRWINASHFVVQQEEMFCSPSPRPAQRLGNYAELYARPAPYDTGDEKYFVTLSLKAVFQFRCTSGKARIVSLTPGPFHH